MSPCRRPVGFSVLVFLAVTIFIVLYQQGEHSSIRQDTLNRNYKKDDRLKHLSQSPNCTNCQNLNGNQEITNGSTEEKREVINCLTKEVIYSYKLNRSKILSINDTLSFQTTNSRESVDDRIKSFKNVFDTRAWGKGSDGQFMASGPGSTLDIAQEVIAVLHTTINYLKKTLGKNEIELLDIPCGDMVWMSRFLQTRNDIKYTGMDIVPNIINHHKKKYTSFKNWSFINADVTNTTLEQYDLILCRMMLQHLFDADVLFLFRKFSLSRSKFILMTTFPNLLGNNDLKSTTSIRFRPMNLQLPPFRLFPPLCMSVDGFGNSHHSIGLWKLPLEQVHVCDQLLHMKNVNYPVGIHACAT